MEDSTTDLVIVEDREGHKTPIVAAIDRSLAELVHEAHETTIEELFQVLLAGSELDRAKLDEVLVYCAERRCIEAGVTCAGCRRRSQAEGFGDIKDFVAAHARIEISDGSGAHVDGPGDRIARFASFDDFYRRWAGEEYWFWARRVLRKLRHGIRRAHIQGEAVAGEGETPAVLLIEPQLADNIGMVARAMANFGLDDLRLVAPRDGWPNERARIAASGANYIIDDAQTHPDLSEATADLHYLCATTARQRDLRKPVLTPEQAVQEMARRIAEGQRCGVLFGREASGLTTDEVAEADALVMIPVNSRFASLNLAQSVLILGYAWILAKGNASLGRQTTYERPLEPGFNFGKDTPARREDLNGFLEQLENDLDAAQFFRPIERRAITLRAIRTMFQRMNATSHEVRTLRGMLKSLRRKRDGD
ncbi:MAG: RNA methyltransferase [Filomicrobium sp.]